MKKNIQLTKINKKKRVLKPWEKISTPSQNSFPQPQKVHCFQCKKGFYIKFVIPHKNYSQKNNWDYWTGEKEKKKICDKCLLELYYNKPLYWETVTDLKKRQQIRKYIYDGTISA